MRISALVAMTPDRLIGINNQIPWHIPADLKYFKEKTIGHHILMGRKCFESIGKPLPGRTNIIVSRNTSLYYSQCHIVRTIEEGILLAKMNHETELFIVGGGEIYSQSQSYWTDLYITWIDADLQGDVYFPQYTQEEWLLQYEEKHEKDSKNNFNYSFNKYIRKTNI
ncbi:MAG: dihydrofolate reductase [Saprospiraceae bacterium]|nr:dihydrofolate reductase [Saprospiraceae bacterium]